MQWWLCLIKIGEMSIDSCKSLGKQKIALDIWLSLALQNVMAVLVSG